MINWPHYFSHCGKAGHHNGSTRQSKNYSPHGPGSEREEEEGREWVPSLQGHAPDDLKNSH